MFRREKHTGGNEALGYLKITTHGRQDLILAPEMNWSAIGQTVNV